MSENKKEEKIVDLRTRVKVYPTETAPYHQEEYKNGESILVAPAVAEKMKRKGWASETQPDKKTKSKGKDDL